MLFRVINAGKSAVNEDQACCEVMLVKKRPTGSSTPCKPSKRRSSLPNGEGNSLAESSVSAVLCLLFIPLVLTERYHRIYYLTLFVPLMKHSSSFFLDFVVCFGSFVLFRLTV